MSKEKQIEEMAEVLRHSCDGECFRNKDGFTDCEACEACLLYEAGYRKQSVSFWGVAKVYNEYLMCHQPRTVCGLCGYELGYEGCCVKPNFCPNCGAKMKGGGE